jgi:hypothetical protein
VYCTAYSNEFVQGNPVTVIVNITRDNPAPEVLVIGAGFEVQPLNTISVETQDPWQPYNGGYYQIFEPNELGIFYAVGGYNSSSVWITEEWYGSGTMIFQNSGPITLQISASLLPTQDIWNDVNWTTFPTEFNVNVTIPNIYIQSSTLVQQQSLAQQELSQQQAETATLNLMQTQQKIGDYQNSSLTYFVLFFACIDIAVVIFDHSKDDDKKAEYEKKNAEEEYRNKIKDIV